MIFKQPQIGFEPFQTRDIQLVGKVYAIISKCEGFQNLKHFWSQTLWSKCILLMVMMIVIIIIGAFSFLQQTFAELLQYPELNQFSEEKKELHTDFQELLAHRGHSDNTVWWMQSEGCQGYTTTGEGPVRFVSG